MVGLDLDTDANLQGPPVETPPPAYEDAVLHSNWTEERDSADEEDGRQNAIDGDENGGVCGSVDDNSSAGGGAGDDSSAGGAAAAAAATAVEEENARLRSELAVFDLGFFEEVEDLKYSYATLKREAERLAKKQGVDLAASLGLPEDGEEPWDRSVDMAHHSVDWAETARRRPPGSPSSPPRGAHAARLARQWNKPSCEFGMDEEGDHSRSDAGFPLGPPTRRKAPLPTGAPRSPSDGASTRRSGRGGNDEPSAPPPWNGLIAAHERKLAWEVSTGGMGSLACLREHIGRIGRSGDGFGSDREVFSALRQSGYALDPEDVAVLRTGLGSSADGKVDLEEFARVCEDIASGEEWYVPAAPAVGAAAVLPPAVAMMMRSPEKWHGAPSRVGDLLSADLSVQEGGGGAERGGGTGEEASSSAFQLYNAANKYRFAASAEGFLLSSASASAGLAGPEPLFLGGTVYGDRSFLEPSKNAEGVMAELRDQLKLLDTDRFFFPRSDPGKHAGGRGARGGGGAATLGRAVGVRFSRRDPSQSGLLSARELGLALEDVGVSLRPEEVITLARKFRPPGETQHQIGGGGGGRDSSVPRLGSSTPSTAVAPAAVGDDGGLDGVVAEYAPLVRQIVDCLAEGAGIDPAVGGRARLGQRGVKWYERMPAPAKRLKAALSGGVAGGGWLERLRQRLASLLPIFVAGVFYARNAPWWL